MNRRNLALLLFFALLLFALQGCNKRIPTVKATDLQKDSPSTEDDSDVQIFRLADNQSDGYPTVLGNLKFSELVYERSEGKIIIKVYSNGQLGNELTALELIQYGAIDFTRAGSYSLASINDKISALSMPYLYDSKEHLYKVLDSSIGDEFLNILTDNNMIGLCWFDAGYRSFYNSQKEIHTPSDMKGMVIRIQESETMSALVTSLGASPVTMGYNEVYSGIYTGIIDGAENNFPSYMSQSHNQVAPYFILDEHTSSPEMLIVNKTVFYKLSQEQQNLLMECAKEAAIYQREEWARQEAEYKEKAIEHGTIITKLTEEELQLFRDAVEPVYDKYPQYTEIVQRIRDLR